MTNEEFMKLFEKSKMNVSQFCRMCGINRSTFYAHKNGKYNIHPLVALKIQFFCDLIKPTFWERVKMFFRSKK